MDAVEHVLEDGFIVGYTDHVVFTVTARKYHMGLFKPKRPLTLFKEEGSKDSHFYGGIASEIIDIGGVVVYVWKYEGVHDQSNERGGIATMLDEGDERTGIQDVVFGENRDRRYADNPVRIKAVYTVPENTLDYAMFGAMLTNDVVQLEMSRHRMLELCGRLLMAGDVVEMTHLQEVGDFDGSVANRYYSVSNVSKGPAGYDHAYKSHVLAITCNPIQGAQEFIDLMERETNTGNALEDIISQKNTTEHLTAKIQQAAEEQVYENWFDDTIIFISDEGSVTPMRWTDDAVPPNGQEAPKFSSFPVSPAEGDYVCRIDFFPARLYRFEDAAWSLKEIDSKRAWFPYSWTNTLRNFSTDRSLEDDLKPWEHISVRDIASPRQGRSVPSPRGAHAAPRSVFDWDRRIRVLPNCVQTSDQTLRIVELFSTPTPLLVSTHLNAGVGEYTHYYIVYSIKSNGIIQNGELLIYDDGTEVLIHDQKNPIPHDADLDITFSVAYASNQRRLYYTMGGNGQIAEMTFFVESKVTGIDNDVQLDFSQEHNSQYLIIVGM